MRQFLSSFEGKVSSVILLIVFIVVLFGPILAPYNPYKLNFSEQLVSPSSSHYFGTDEMGRDLFSRVLVGARMSILTSLTVVSLSGLIGILLGLIAAHYKGVWGTVIMRLVDMFIGFPPLIIAIAIVAAAGAGLRNALLGVLIIWWPGYTRLMRGQTLSVEEEAYIEAAEAAGAGTIHLIRKHILPNTFPPILVKATLDVGWVIIFIAALGFVGLGAQPPSPEWGAILSQSRRFLTNAWWYPTLPGLTLSLVVVGFNLFGDAFQTMWGVERQEGGPT